LYSTKEIPGDGCTKELWSCFTDWMLIHILKTLECQGSQWGHSLWRMVWWVPSPAPQICAWNPPAEQGRSVITPSIRDFSLLHCPAKSPLLCFFAIWPTCTLNQIDAKKLSSL
jgi:hypothetical protein